jgi:hypothetical protein
MPPDADPYQHVDRDRRRHRGPVRGRHARRSGVRPVVLGLTATASLTVIGAVTLGTPYVWGSPKVAAASRVVPDDRAERAAAGSEASRTFDRAVPPPSEPPLLGPSASPTASRSRPVRPAPVAGLSRATMDNAVAVVEAGRQLHLPPRAHLVALTTALQESGLRNLANSGVPASLKHTNQGVEHNFDSIGIFQQRPSQGWGTVSQLMDPATAARLFYARLVKVSGWERMSVGDAAQAVQRSAFPDAYAKQQPRAERILAAIP